MKGLTNFNISGASLFEAKMEAIAQWVREVLKIEDLVSIEKNLSIAPLLRLCSGPLSLSKDVEAILDKLRTDLLFDMATRKHHIQEIKGLLVLAHKEMENPLSSQLDHGEHPPLVRKIGHLKATILKDKIKKVQRVYFMQ
ncbi:hypothetical protein AMTRI_Chr02g216060 [Amborella trichopoda]